MCNLQPTEDMLEKAIMAFLASRYKKGNGGGKTQSSLMICISDDILYNSKKLAILGGQSQSKTVRGIVH